MSIPLPEQWKTRLCKSGEVLLYHNVVTGETKWPNKPLGENVKEATDPNKLASVAGGHVPSRNCHGGAQSKLSKESNLYSATTKSGEREIFSLCDVQTNAAIPSSLNHNNNQISPAQESGIVGDQATQNTSVDVSFEVRFAQSSELQIHTSCLEDNKYQCQQCSKTFSKKRGLTRHMRSHDNKTETRCMYCGKVFQSKKNIARHVRTHTQEKPYTCSFCPKAFSDASIRKRHMRTHTLERPFICKLCGRSFSQSQSLRFHEITHIGMTAPSGSGPKVHKCTYCPKGFCRQSDLVRHVRTHTGARPFQCTYCPKAFMSSFNCIRHIRGCHINDKPHRCEICDKAYVDRADLTRHKLVHAPKELVSCPICNSTFTMKRSLKRHMKSHSDEKSFKCKTCNRSFKHKGAMLMHRTLNHEAQNFRCGKCGRGFTYRSCLEQHRKNNNCITSLVAEFKALTKPSLKIN